jgi:hypothetical protein
LRDSAVTNDHAAPETLTLSEHRDRGQGRVRPKHIGVALLVLIVLAALLNLFGQRPQTSTASAPVARLQLYAPERVRGGLMYSARFRIDARQELKNAKLVLDPGWADQYTVNGVAPQPSSEDSQNGKLSFTLGAIPAGQHSTLFVSLQVNPTNIGHHAQTVWLYDGQRELAAIHHTITIWP